MRFFKNQRFLLAGYLAVYVWSSAGCASAQIASIKPLPIYDQCQVLNAGTAADGAVAKAITALKGQDSKARTQAAQQLGKSCDRRAVDPLIDTLGDNDPSVRIAAVEALGKLGDQETVQSLIDVTGDKDSRVRLALISALISFPGFKGRNAVVNNIANPNGADVSDETDMRVRCAAILTACQLKDVSHSRKSILFLYGFLSSQHATTRKLAEQTLMELKNTRNGQTEMVAILKQSSDPELRRWAATWIGKIGLTGAREALQEAAATDSDPTVKQLAADSLKQLPQ